MGCPMDRVTGKTFIRHSLIAGLLTACGLASAAPVIGAGTTYNLTLFGSGGPDQTTVTATFDGVAETFTRLGNTFSVDETQTDLGGGLFSVGFTISAATDLFPVANGGGFLNIGLSNPLNLLFDVQVNSALLFFQSIGTAQTVGFIQNNDPWDGTYNGPSSGVGFANAGGRGVTDINLTLTLARAVPEPGSLALAMLALTGLGVARRRRQRQA